MAENMSSVVWLSAKEAAAYVGFSEKTLANWRTRRQGPAYIRRVGSRARGVRYRIGDLDDFLALSRNAPEEAASGSMRESAQMRRETCP